MEPMRRTQEAGTTALNFKGLETQRPQARESGPLSKGANCNLEAGE